MSTRTDQEHYSHEDWVDFVRAATAPERHEAMERHLAAGCGACREIHDTWRAVLAVTREESRFEPPAQAMRLARAVFVATNPQRGVGLARATPRLLFDSLLTAAPAGVRTLRPAPRKLVYETDECLLDLQLEPSKDRAKVVLIGQVAQPDEDNPAAGLPVLLLRQLKLIGSTLTNALGEFRVELDGTSGDLTLAVVLDDTAMVIELGDLI